MQSSALNRLELPKILNRLAGHCACPLGRARVAVLQPTSQHPEARSRLAETSEARRFIETVRYPPFGGIDDVSGPLRAAAIGGTLDAAQLLAIGRAAEGCRRLHATLLSPEAEFPGLKSLAARITPRPDLEKAIYDAIDDSGEIKDDASLDLLKARRNIRQTQSLLQNRLRSMLTDPNVLPHLQDAFVTVRDGRYCLPVKSESRSSVPGILHDRSSSGGAVFIEPQAVIDMNNRLRELAAEEREAIIQILRALSGHAGGAATDLGDSLEAAGQLDFAFAKAQLSLTMKAREPRIRDDASGYHLVAARHPLVEHCIPNDIRLGDESAVTERGDFDVMLLTGPNTGGKTVVLKTLGLLAAMTGCGLHLPVEENSWLSLPGQLHVDIGDEQSIEQSLSTFSGHLKNIVAILRDVQPNDLVLFDEIGAGTDPDEGAALAKAVLRTLSRRGAKVLATTHYGELKHFAISAGRFENASVEFDTQSLRPTYHLRIGVPGASNALDIAARLGMPSDLVARARRYLGRDRMEAEAATVRLEETQRELQSQTDEIKRGREEVETLRRQYETQLASLASERQKELDKARREGRELVDAARSEADEALRELRRAARQGQSQGQGENKETEVARHRLRTLRERFEAAGLPAAESLKPPAPRPDRPHVPAPPAPQVITSRTPNRPVFKAPEPPPPEWKAGDLVHVKSIDRDGEILRLDGERAEVRVGVMKIEARVADFEPVKRANDKVSGVAAIQSRKAWTVAPELHLLGKTTNEAIMELEQYVDDALLAGMAEIRVVHGRGTGALRQAVHRWLKSQRNVSEFELAPQNEGGEGATVVKLA